jgi:hypothetical protein
MGPTACILLFFVGLGLLPVVSARARAFRDDHVSELVKTLWTKAVIGFFLIGLLLQLIAGSLTPPSCQSWTPGAFLGWCTHSTSEKSLAPVADAAQSLGYSASFALQEANAAYAAMSSPDEWAEQNLPAALVAFAARPYSFSSTGATTAAELPGPGEGSTVSKGDTPEIEVAPPTPATPPTPTPASDGGHRDHGGRCGRGWCNRQGFSCHWGACTDMRFW